MCLIAFAWSASERFPFVIAANRDEFLQRPTAPLSRWQTPANISVLSGRDRQDGGTWMGFSPSCRFAMLTNVRAQQAKPHAHPISRGGLALSWLESDLPVTAWAQSIDAQRYQGFNLIVGDWNTKQCHYLSNQAFLKPFEPLAHTKPAQSAPNFVATEMPRGAIYGLSNAALDTPWPKTQRLKAALQASLDGQETQQLIAHNLQALEDCNKPSAAHLPSTGVPAELELALSSAYVSHPENAPTYGTRTSLVAVFEAGLGLRVTEITHSHDGTPPSKMTQALAWR